MSKTTTEVAALVAIDEALSGLEDLEARGRVLRWAVSKFGTAGSTDAPSTLSPASQNAPPPLDETPGISGTAALWLRRNGIHNENGLASIFSLGQQDLDVIAADVPGANGKGRMRSVLLLRGVCSFLKTGEFRFSDEISRETCKHYNAYNKNNFARYLAEISDEVTGTRETGYTLTPKGQKAAADLLKTLV